MTTTAPGSISGSHAGGKPRQRTSATVSGPTVLPGDESSVRTRTLVCPPVRRDRKKEMTMMSRMSRTINQYPLITYFALTYALSWWPWIFYVFDLLPQPIVGFGPFLAAVVVLGATRGKAGVFTLLRQMVQWRFRPRWYAVALLLPIAITVTATGCNVLAGAPVPSAVELGDWTRLPGMLLFLLLVPGIGGAWEEPGWRGYALPRLQSGRSALSASAILWLGLVVWHLPLVVVGEIHWSDIVFLLGFAVVFNWIFNNTGGSVLSVMLAHAMNNTISGDFFGPMFSGVDFARQSWISAAIWCAVAIVVVVAAGPQHLSRHYEKQEETTASEAPGAFAPTNA